MEKPRKSTSNPRESRLRTTIDCHVHVWPESLVQRNLEAIRSQSGVTPVFDGSISSLHNSMNRGGVATSIINNLVLRAGLVNKANDWTASMVLINSGLVGLGWVIAGLAESVDEVSRCISGLNFKGIKMHHSHSKVFPDDPRNYCVYEKISELGVPVLFHCGKNPYSKDSSVQFSAPSKFRPVLSSFNKMKVILGHLAGYEDYPEEALDILSNFPNAWADTAVESPDKLKINEIVARAGVNKIIFGSDYPIRDPSVLLSWLKAALAESDFDMITHKTPTKLFQI